MIRTAIIGCGKIADLHAEHLCRLDDVEIVSCCDSELLMASQLAERYRIPAFFKDLEELLTESKPDVVHITTPPQSHHEIGKKSIAAGCHVLMEKPFTLNTMEAEELIALAEAHGVKITVNHNAQYTIAARRFRKLAESGYLGEGPYHLEAYYCYDLGDQSYAKALLGDKEHWVRNLPGQLLHNIISHGISKAAEYLQDENPKVTAVGRSSPILLSIGEDQITDELRVIMEDSGGTTAYFTFSTTMNPKLHLLRIFGTRNGAFVDDDHQTVIKLSGGKYKSYLNQFMPPLNMAANYFANAVGNLWRFIRNDFHMNSGFRFHANAFYDSIRNGGPPPISYNEILRTSRIMDEIFSQLNTQKKKS